MLTVVLQPPKNSQMVIKNHEFCRHDIKILNYLPFSRDRPKRAYTNLQMKSLCIDVDVASAYSNELVKDVFPKQDTTASGTRYW